MWRVEWQRAADVDTTVRRGRAKVRWDRRLSGAELVRLLVSSGSKMGQGTYLLHT